MSYEIEELVRETKQAIGDKVAEKTAPLEARMNELEQKTALGFGGARGPSLAPSAGKQFIESDAFKGLMENLHPGRRVSLEVKAIISALTTDANGSAGDLLVPYRDEYVTTPKRRLTIRDLLTVVPITGNAVQYPKLTGYTNSAATVSETAGDEKPQSELKFDIETANVTTIAHWVYAMRQILEDAPQLAALIDSELRYGLAYAEELQLLSGGGTGTDLNGIYTQATASTANLMTVTSPTKIDVIGAALYQQDLTNIPADGIVLHPSDWTSIQLTKDSAGNYIVGDPQAALQPTLFSKPVVVTPAMSSGNFLVGAFKTARLYDRLQARVEVATEDGDGFRLNRVTVLCEERIALAVPQPLAFTKGSFATQITDLTS